MTRKKINFLIILCMLIVGEICSQNIRIHYHRGFDCNMEINGERERGGCTTNEKLEFTHKKNGKKIESKVVVIEKEKRAFIEGKFGDNIEADSFKMCSINKKINKKEFFQLVDLLELSSVMIIENQQSNYLIKKLLTKLTKKSFQLNSIDISRIKRVAKKGGFSSNQDSLIKRLSGYFVEENSGFLVSSIVEFLSIEFKYNGKLYSISQHNLGEVNVSWQIKINEGYIYIISSKMNELISSFLPRNMKAKKKLIQFKKIKQMKKAFKKE